MRVYFATVVAHMDMARMHAGTTVRVCWWHFTRRFGLHFRHRILVFDGPVRHARVGPVFSFGLCFPRWRGGGREGGREREREREGERPERPPRRGLKESENGGIASSGTL